MLSLIAITLAVNFWAPYNGGIPPCGGHPVIRDLSEDVQEHPPETAGFAYFDGSCEIFVAKFVSSMSIEFQCAVVAHEVGHKLGLEHSDDPKNIMFFAIINPPRQCYFRFPNANNSAARVSSRIRRSNPIRRVIFDRRPTCHQGC